MPLTILCVVTFHCCLLSARSFASTRLSLCFAKSSSICFSHVFFGALRCIFHPVVCVLHNSRCGRRCGFMRQIWPNHRIRRFWISSNIVGCLQHHSLMVSFRILSRIEILRIRRKQRIWKTSSFFRPPCSNVHDSAPYSSTESTSDL